MKSPPEIDFRIEIINIFDIIVKQAKRDGQNAACRVLRLVFDFFANSSENCHHFLLIRMK